jgi:vancomycin permeability regulator SanA
MLHDHKNLGRLALRRLVAGASGLIAITSAAAAIAAMRQSSIVEPYVWVQNPIGSGPVASQLWHALLTLIYGCAFVLCFVRASVRPLRVAVALALTLLALLAARDSATYYYLVFADRISTEWLVPLSVFILGTSSSLAWFVWLDADHRTARNTQTVWDILVGTAGAGILLLAHLMSFGTTDYTRTADVAVVLGAKVYPDGTPSLSLSDRLDTGIELYRHGHVRYLLMTGGTGVEGCNEALAMRDFAIGAGVAEEDILIDTEGVNTVASARNCREILAQHGLVSALLVSHYFHLARCKMMFVDHGIPCATVPAHMTRRPTREVYFVLRECVAYLVYSLERPIARASVRLTDHSLAPRHP